MNSEDTLQAHELTREERARAAEAVVQALDERTDLLSPIPCASPSEEPQVGEVVTGETSEND